MNMFYNFTYIPVETLKKDGFEITEHGENRYASLKYGNDAAFVNIEKIPEKCVGDICMFSGSSQYNILRKLYELYKVDILPEGLYETEEFLHTENENEKKDLFFEMVTAKFREEILSKRIYSTSMALKANPQQIKTLINTLYDAYDNDAKMLKFWEVIPVNEPAPEVYSCDYNKKYFGQSFASFPNIDIGMFPDFVNINFNCYAIPFIRKLAAQLKNDNFDVRSISLEASEEYFQEKKPVFYFIIENEIDEFIKTGKFEEIKMSQKIRNNNEDDLPF